MTAILYRRIKQKRETRKLSFVILLICYVILITYIHCVRAVLLWAVQDSKDELSTDLDQNWTSLILPGLGVPRNSVGDVSLNCTPRAVEEMPQNFFTKSQTMDGAIAVHIFLALYMFGSLAIICDDYFAPCLEVICEKLHLTEDVAGSTFLAIGSSAPEFFTSLIALFVTKSDIGVGAILGSATCNTLFVIGVLPLTIGTALELHFYPTTRDCIFYLVSVTIFVASISDGLVYWYDAVCLLMTYVLYILVMVFNRKIKERVEKVVYALSNKCWSKREEPNDRTSDIVEEQPLSDHTISGRYGTILEESEEEYASNDTKILETSFTVSSEKIAPPTNVAEEQKSNTLIPFRCIAWVYWVVMLPAKILMYLTVPDCKKTENHKFYQVAFLASLAWIAACTYLLVWMITILGDSLGIPDTVVSLTILGAGTSVPDCLNSIVAARAGNHDMAVCNSLASNIIDVLVCLGLPWLIKTAIMEHGEPLAINSRGISYTSFILLSSVVFLMLAVGFSKFRLTKKFSMVSLVAYVTVIIISCLIELNIFGDFVLPPCPSLKVV